MSDGQNFKDVIVQEKLDPPSSFLFPFTPYVIQHDFMTKLYSALENKKLGIFESPTGTVSLKIILNYVSLMLQICNSFFSFLKFECILNILISFCNRVKH